MIKILPGPNLTPTNSVVMFINHQRIPIDSYSEISEFQDFIKNDLSRESAFSVFKGGYLRTKTYKLFLRSLPSK